MKDAKGHGSDARGSHSGGVAKVGLPIKISPKAVSIIQKQATTGFSVTPSGKVPTTGFQVALQGRTESLPLNLENRGKSPETLVALAKGRAHPKSIEYRQSPENAQRLAAEKNKPGFRERHLAGIYSPDNLAHLSVAQKTSPKAISNNTSPENIARLARVRESGRERQLMSAKSPENIERLRAMARAPEAMARNRSPENIARLAAVAEANKDKIIATLKANGAKMRGVKWAPERIAKRSATRRANTILRKQLTGDAA
jgi:hypothetical protein